MRIKFFFFLREKYIFIQQKKISGQQNIMDIVGYCNICGADILERSWAQRRNNLCHKHLSLKRTKHRYHTDSDYKSKRKEYGFLL